MASGILGVSNQREEEEKGHHQEVSSFYFYFSNWKFERRKRKRYTMALPLVFLISFSIRTIFTLHPNVIS